MKAEHKEKEKIGVKRQQRRDAGVLRTKIAVPIGPMSGHKGNRARVVEVVYLDGRNPI